MAGRPHLDNQFLHAGGTSSLMTTVDDSSHNRWNGECGLERLSAVTLSDIPAPQPRTARWMEYLNSL